MACSQGYPSSLAAAALVDLGLRRAADLVGGFHAWRDAGLPVRAAATVATALAAQVTGVPAARHREAASITG